MKILGAGCSLVIQILREEIIIRSRIYQKTAVASGRRDYKRIGCIDIFRYNKFRVGAFPPVGILQETPELVISDFRDQRHIRPELMQGQSRIRDASSG